MSDDANNAPLPRRDWFLLPLVVVTTALGLCLIAELVSRALFVESGKFTCAVRIYDNIMRQQPNCVSHYKSAEGPNVEYRFNNCGYRSPDPCGPKPAGTVRIVFMGSSLTMGLHVREDEMFAVRTERALQRLHGRRVDAQNLAGLMLLKQQIGFTPEALALSPDVIVLTVMPWDLEELAGPERAPVAAPAKSPGRLRSMLQDAGTQIRESKAVFAVAHFIFQDPQTVYHYYLREGRSRDVMSSPITTTGQQMYDGFASLVESFMTQVRKSGVPVVVVAVPNRVTAAIVSTNAHVEKTDAWSFGRRVCNIATTAGALCVDVTQDFARIPDAERLFYAVDNHPTGDGHAVIAKALTARLLDGSIPRLSAASSLATR